MQTETITIILSGVSVHLTLKPNWIHLNEGLKSDSRFYRNFNRIERKNKTNHRYRFSLEFIIRIPNGKDSQLVSILNEDDIRKIFRNKNLSDVIWENPKEV